MLVLIVKQEESIKLTGPGTVKVIGVDGSRVKCGVIAPRSTRVELVKD